MLGEVTKARADREDEEPVRWRILSPPVESAGSGPDVELYPGMTHAASGNDGSRRRDGAVASPIVAPLFSGARRRGIPSLCRFEEDKPSVILLDLMIPAMNGWEFRAAQTRDPAIASIPVIVITGAGNVASRAATPGIAGLLEKPVDLDTLLSAVRRYRGASQG